MVRQAAASPRAATPYDPGPMRVLCIHQEPDSTLGTLEAAVHERGHELETWYACNGEESPNLRRYGAVYALGGITNPDDDGRQPWLALERELLAACVRDGVPTLAICLGAQLLADALGGRVGRLPQWELGWYEVRFAEAARSDPLLVDFPQSTAVFQWHDYGFELPVGALDLGCSTACPCQAFRVGARAWGLQFHLEIDAPTIDAWTRASEHSELAEKGLARSAILADTAREIEAYSRLADGLSHRFLGFAERLAGDG
jgi:GMP synthase (glutamine-hydrolysing)